MKQIAFPIHDTQADAITADIISLGGFKAVAGKLWPSAPEATATAKLRNALNPDQAQILPPEELLRIKKLAREAGFTATVDWEAAEIGYQVTWVSPEDELERIERENNELLKALVKRQERADLLKERAALKVVR
jgi:hypothetical protein